MKHSTCYEFRRWVREIYGAHEYHLHLSGSEPAGLDEEIRRKKGEKTVTDISDLQKQAIDLATKCLEMERWLDQARGNRMLPPDVRAKIPAREKKLLEVRAELQELEGIIVVAIRKWLAAQPKGRILIQRKDQQVICLSATPVFNAPWPVWLPEQIAALLRIRTLFGQDDVGNLDSVAEWISETMTRDPVTRAIPKQRVKKDEQPKLDPDDPFDDGSSILPGKRTGFGRL